MRVSSFSVLVVVPFSFAAPILSNRGFFGDAATAVGNLINSNATLSGVAGAVKQSVENPALTIARVQVVKNLAAMQKSIDTMGPEADATGNAGVTSLIANAQQGVSTAHDAINRIGDALVSGTATNKDDQKDVAVGIKDAQTAVNAMSAAITTPDAQLSSDIDTATTNAQKLAADGEEVLSASDLTFADLGLPDDFASS